MKAEPLLDERHQLTAESFVELRIWRAPQPVRGSNHDLKYALAYVVAGVCMLRYDNEAGKGDHRQSGRDRDGLRLHHSGQAAGGFLERCGSMEAAMNTVTLSIASREDVNRRALAAFEGRKQGAHISFASPELLWSTLTRKRWGLLQAMTGQGVLSIREAARRVGRDVKAVHGDVQALLNAGVIERAEGGVRFPYDAVHVDFMLTSAA